MGARLFVFLLTVLSSVCLAADDGTSTTATVKPGDLDIGLTTTIGSTLDPKNSLASVTLEPALVYHFDARTALAAYAEIDRPFDPYLNFTNPRTYLLLTRDAGTLAGMDTTLRLTLQATNTHRWSTDGYQFRAYVGGQFDRKLGKGFSLMARVETHGDLTQYRQTTDGRDLARMGFSERVALAYSPGDFNFELHLITAQTYHGSGNGRALWKNAYVTAQVAEYRIDDRFLVGLSHELLTGVIDETTGLRRSIRAFDSRDSRVSAYVDVTL